MTARWTARVAFSLVLTSLAAGCTIHTYSGARPGTTYTRSEPIRYEVSYRSSERDRGYVLPREKDRARDKARADSGTKTVRPDDAQIATRDRVRWTARDAGGSPSSAPVAAKPSKVERGDAAAKPAAKPATKPAVTPRPASDSRGGDAVTLAEAEEKEKYGRLRSFDERLGEVFEQKKAKIAREKKERQARMERAVGAATEKHL